MNKQIPSHCDIRGYQKITRWPDVYFAAEAAKDPFGDVDIITARIKLIELAYDAACHTIYSEGLSLSLRLVTDIARTMIETGKVFVQESVTINQDKITCCIDVDNVNDDDVVWKILDMVAVTLEQLDGHSGTILFGNPLDITIEDIAELVNSHPLL